MKVRTLGCSGSMAADHHTTAFLIDDDVLIDAGSGVGTLSIDALRCIDTVFLTHAHLDHILGLPLLADGVLRHRREQGLGPIMVYGLPATLEALRQHVFNNAIWPDFTSIPSAQAPVLKLQPVAVGDRIRLEQRVIQVLPARHVVPAVGYAVWQESSEGTPQTGWGYSGDTGPNPELWPVLAQLPWLQHWVTEVAFPNRDAHLARISGHHCPASLEPELLEWAQHADVAITHVKPGEAEVIEVELRVLRGGSPLRMLQEGASWLLGPQDAPQSAP